ncbi:beta adaptin protein [Cyclospora cayetanensis]|uniref:Beta adaptin protein n=1 Tax=Cyclospora cayetanensis TaxID=88456 RepID=A0A1D3CRV1_9EIME|nr:beta adaptin protein [Cyclospora cayetanensis]
MSESHYFQPSKRGELHELKEELHSSNKDKKKDAVKRVIAAMTVGKDVSSLFPDVVNCMQTNNIELKKLVYLYVINYAKVQPELAILAVNTFRKDSLDPNPLIRALALRTMGYIRLEAIAEYLVEPLLRCCTDPDPYVRKTAAICIAKLHDIRADMVEAEQLLDVLKKMFADSNPVVVANAVAALSEISDASGKNLLKQFFSEDESSVTKLLTALNECTEWGQVFILDALIHFDPPSPLVLSAVKVILKLLNSISNADVIQAAHRKLCPPLITLLSAEPEVQYVALRNIELIVRRRPSILANDVKVLAELREYANDVDHEMARRSIRCIGRLCMRLPGAVDRCIQALLDLLSHKAAYAVQECAVVLRDICRKYTRDYSSVVPAICEVADLMDEPEARASIVWIIGQYSQHLPDATELLSTFASSFLEEVGSVQLQILTAAVKLFMLHPKHNQQLVMQLLKTATEEADNPDVRDRALIYWRMLSRNPEAARKVVFAPKGEMSAGGDDFDDQTLTALLSSDSGPVDLLDLSESSSASMGVSKCPEPPPVVLTAETPGSRQQRGLEIRAALRKPEGGSLQLYLRATNRTGAPLSDFALQFNKNSFGLAPGGPLTLPVLAPGTSADTVLTVLPNQLNSNSPPTSPLFIQVAVKCSLDIFYFSVSYSLAEVLEERGPIHKELFRQHWQALGEAKQGSTTRQLAKPLSPQDATSLLKQQRVFLVAQRATDTYDAIYFSAVTTNNLLVLLELSMQRGSPMTKVVIRTEVAALVPLFEHLVASTLGLLA